MKPCATATTGATRSGGIAATERNYTGQHKDAGTGLLFYNARYYDPALARFVSADSMVPGTSHRSLTVDFHEGGFISAVAGENNQGFWFQMGGQQRQNAMAPWGPGNPQELNRYSYTGNNPLNQVDPNGHDAIIVHTPNEAERAIIAINTLLGDDGLAFNLDEIAVGAGYKDALSAEIKVKFDQMVDTFGAEFATFMKQLSLALADMIEGASYVENGIYISMDQWSDYTGQDHVKMRWGTCETYKCDKKHILGNVLLSSSWDWVALIDHWDDTRPDQGRGLWQNLWDSQVAQN